MTGMHCRYCDESIGRFYRYWDTEYCSSVHRQAGTSRSARALRRAAEVDEAPLPSPREESEDGGGWRTVFGWMRRVAYVGVLVAPSIYWFELRHEAGWVDSLALRVSNQAQYLLQRSEQIELKQSFDHSSLTGWLAKGKGGGAILQNGLLRPGRFSLWEKTAHLGDYYFEFHGRIDRAAMGWIMRAKDSRNYYAVKLKLITRNGHTGAELERVHVEGGKETGRIRFPLALPIQAGKFYNVGVRARGDRLVTFVEGEPVDSWGYVKIARGGVGFFSEADERASIRWARVTSGDLFPPHAASMLPPGFAPGEIHRVCPGAAPHSSYDPPSPCSDPVSLLRTRAGSKPPQPPG